MSTYKSTTTVKLSKSIIQSLLAVSVATDKNRTSAVLTGIYLSISASQTCICATDGKILATHEYPAINLEAGNGQDTIQETIHIIIQWHEKDKDAQKALKFLAKSKALYHTFVIDHENDLEYVDSVNRQHGTKLTIEGMNIPLITQGRYPNYQNAAPVEAEYKDCGVQSLNAHYIANMAKTFILPKHAQGIVMVPQGKGKGVMFYPAHTCSTFNQRALLMPITLPSETVSKYDHTDRELSK